MIKWRKIVSLTVALVVALLPILGNMALADTINLPSTQVVISASHDCCEDGGAGGGTAMFSCQPSVGCSLKCLNIYALVCSGTDLSGAVPRPEPLLIYEVVPARSVYPPFRPPRV